MKDTSLKMISAEIAEKLKAKGLNYLNVEARGSNIVIYSEYEGAKENRCRFSKITNSTYLLGMANHCGKWEATPFDGTLDELLEIVVTDFEWVLTDYSLDN